MADEPDRLLVVDDNPGDARLVELTLAQDVPGRYRVERAGRIADALARLAEAPVRAVLLDLGLPDSRGTDGLRRIRERAPTVPVLVLSGAEDPEVARAAYDAGAQDYQVKGVFPPGELDRRLRVAIAVQRIEDALRSDAPPDPIELGAIASADEGLAVLLGPGRTLENERFTPLAGGAAGTSSPGTEWLGALLRELSDPHPTLHGWFAREGDPPLLLEYLVRRLAAPSRPTIVRLHCRGGSPSAAPAPRGPEAYPSGAFDPGILGQLEELGGGDPRFVPELIATFLREGDAIVRRLASASVRGDWPAIARDAHTLKSAAAQVGALRLSRLAVDLERRSSAMETAETRALVGEVADEFLRVETAPIGKHAAHR
jgi:DNA-binding response OmpR family regulator/HPt (histidine-containing phosphotransfer) domain-containing protein